MEAEGRSTTSKQTLITDYFHVMETSVADSTTPSDPKLLDKLLLTTSDKGLPFLRQLYTYYIILFIRLTTVYEITEIVEIGFVILDKDMKQLYKYNKFITPSILTRLSTTTSRQGVPYDLQNPTLTEILHDIAQDSFLSKAFKKGLIIVHDDSVMSSHFPGQCTIEQALNKALPSQSFMQKRFDRWCCLLNMYTIIRRCITTRDNLKAFVREYHKLQEDYNYNYKYDDRCIDQAIATIPMVQFFANTLTRSLFPTRSVTRPNAMYGSAPVYCTFRNYLECQAIYCNKFDKDGIYVGSDSEEEAIAMELKYSDW